MFISPAYAQAGGAPGADIFSLLAPIIMIMAIFWFLILRPQQKRMKAHQELVANVRRGDTIVTAGGIVGKVTKVVDDGEIVVDTGEGGKFRMIKSAITEVRVKGEPAKAD
ncbi:MAG: preprotein translocase subunit YajC [Anderseniella sp.]